MPLVLTAAPVIVAAGIGIALSPSLKLSSSPIPAVQSKQTARPHHQAVRQEPPSPLQIHCLVFETK